MRKHSLTGKIHPLHKKIIIYSLENTRAQGIIPAGNSFELVVDFWVSVKKGLFREDAGTDRGTLLLLLTLFGKAKRKVRMLVSVFVLSGQPCKIIV
jgi:hypothetical protein